MIDTKHLRKIADEVQKHFCVPYAQNIDDVADELDQLRGNLSIAEEGLANYAQEALSLHEQIARLQLERAAAIDRLTPLGLEITRLRTALEKIMDYDPGQFRPLEDEIAIWRLATEALAACSGVPQSGDATQQK